MIEYPVLKEQPSFRQVVDTFKGYHHNLRIGANEFYEMENMTSEDYPVLSVRGPRGRTSIAWDGACLGAYYVPGIGLYHVQEYDGDSSVRLLKPTGEDVLLHYHALNAKPKQFALMGKRLIIAPDMKAVEIGSSDMIHLSDTWQCNTGTVELRMCDANGNLYEGVTAAAKPPSAPGYHDLWLCTAVGDVGLRQYEPASSQWVSISTTYLKLTGLGDHHFEAGDGIHISGLAGAATSLNGSYVLQQAGHGDLVITGVIFAPYTQDCAATPVTIERKVPELDFIVESGNRLWGCSNERNELYACKLGDPKNWNCFQGLSTDSWVASIGTPGAFTGAVVQSGYPIFYKEDCKHKVWPSSTGAHQLTATPCNGVEKGSCNSLAVLGGTVFYKSGFGICADDGGGPVEIGHCLGSVEYHNACGAVHDRKYYVCMRDSDEKSHLFVYDMARKLWHREDSTYTDCLAAGGGGVFLASGGDLWDLTGSTGTPEGPVSWMVQTGDLGLEIPEQKYISRLTLRASLDPGATLEIYAQYDREPAWVKLGQVYGTSLRSFSLPVRPRRCDQLRLRLQGTGMCKIYSITKTLEKGSELS